MLLTSKFAYPIEPNLQRIEDFQRAYAKVLNDLETLHVLLLEHRAVRSADAAYAVQHCAGAHVEVLRSIEAIIANGTFRIQPPVQSAKMLTRSCVCQATEKVFQEPLYAYVLCCVQGAGQSRGKIASGTRRSRVLKVTASANFRCDLTHPLIIY